MIRYAMNQYCVDSYFDVMSNLKQYLYLDYIVVHY